MDFDFDNLLLLVTGKGRKQRKVPFSIELRKLLFRFTQMKEKAGVRSELMFPARDGGKWEHRNARRSYYCLLKTLGLPQSGFHLLHVRNATPEERRRRGAPLHHPLALGDRNDDEVSALAHGGLAETASGVVDLESVAIGLPPRSHRWRSSPRFGVET